MKETKQFFKSVVDVVRGTASGINKFVNGEPIGTTFDQRLEIFVQMAILTALAELSVTVLSGARLSLTLGVLGLMAGLFYDPNYQDNH